MLFELKSKLGHLQTSISTSFFGTECFLTYLYLLLFQLFVLLVCPGSFSKQDLFFLLCVCTAPSIVKCHFYLSPLNFVVLQVVGVAMNNRKLCYFTQSLPQEKAHPSRLELSLWYICKVWVWIHAFHIVSHELGSMVLIMAHLHY